MKQFRQFLQEIFADQRGYPDKDDQMRDKAYKKKTKSLSKQIKKNSKNKLKASKK